MPGIRDFVEPISGETPAADNWKPAQRGGATQSQAGKQAAAIGFGDGGASRQ
jgi:hypothetical protein